MMQTRPVSGIKAIRYRIAATPCDDYPLDSTGSREFARRSIPRRGRTDTK